MDGCSVSRILVNGDLRCTDCGKLIMRVSTADTINGRIYCHACKALFRVLIANGKVYEMEITE